MKTAYSDLSVEVQNKLDRLDNIADKSGYVYVENGNFIVKDVDTNSLKQIYTHDDIIALKKHLYKSEDNYISGYDKSLLLTNTARNTDKLLNFTDTTTIFKNQYKYVKYFTCDSNIYLLNSVGYLYVVDTITMTFSTIKLFQILKDKFIFKPLYSSNILNITKYDDGNNSPKIIVSTDIYGIYIISDDNHCELLNRECNVDIIKQLPNNNIICAKTSTLVNNLFVINNDGRILITYNQIAKKQEYIKDILIGANAFYVISDNMTSLHSSSVIHKFILDLNSISYTYEKSNIKNKLDRQYLFKAYDIDADENVYILTIFNNTPVVWKYNNEFNNIEYYTLQNNLNYDDIFGFKVINNKYYIITNTTEYIYDKSDIIKNIRINSKYSDIIFVNNNIYTVNDLTINKINDIEVKDYALLTLNLSFLKNINNIDIYIDTNDKLTYTFYDKSNNNEIKPAYGVYLNSTNALFKIINNTSELYLQINGLSDKSVINGVVIHSNNIYYK